MTDTIPDVTHLSWAEVRTACHDIAATAVTNRVRTIAGASTDGMFVALIVKEIAGLRWGHDMLMVTATRLGDLGDLDTEHLLIVDVTRSRALRRYATSGAYCTPMHDPNGPTRYPWQHGPAPLDALIALAESMDPTRDCRPVAAQVAAWLDAKLPADRARILGQIEQATS